MKNMFQLNAWLSELLAPSDCFDPKIAEALFESLPYERVPFFGFAFLSKSSGPTQSGMTNAGSASFSNSEEKTVSAGMSRGTWIGKWRVVRDGLRMTIEPKFDELLDGDIYEIRFSSLGSAAEFLKSEKRVFSLGFIQISFSAMKKWKTPMRQGGVPATYSAQKRIVGA